MLIIVNCLKCPGFPDSVSNVYMRVLPILICSLVAASRYEASQPEVDRSIPEKQGEVPRRWNISTDERTNGQHIVTATLRADAPVALPSGDVIPLFIARCSDESVEVLLHFGTVLDYQPPLRVSWDGRESLDYYWTASTDSQALVSSSPLGWFDTIWDMQELRVAFQPSGSEPLVATFTAIGWGKVMKLLLDSCSTLADRVEQYRAEPKIDLTWDASLAPTPPVRVGCCRYPPPQKLKHVPPTYPREALTKRPEGIVILDLLISARGEVRDARVVRSIPLLDAAALEAVRRWIFTPSLVHGVAVPIVHTVTVQFEAP